MNHDKVSELRKILNQDPVASPKPPENPEISNEETPPSVAENADWQAKCKELEKQIQNQKEELLRTMADFENSRKRLAKSHEESLQYANEKILQEIFPVLDSLEMTLSHVTDSKQDDPIVSGVQLILKQLLQVLEKHGLKEVGVIGETFDPHWHEAIGSEASAEQAPNAIVRVHRKGYKLKDRLIRAALVTISQ